MDKVKIVRRKLNCPVCGAKLYNNQVCRYCNDVTIDRIINASNFKVRKARKEDRDSICYSTYIPSDVNMTILWLLTIFAGYIGLHNFYVKKTIKGMFSSVSLVLLFVFITLQELSKSFGWGGENGLQIFVTLLSILSAIAVLFWFFDIIALLTKKFKLPVVLGDIKKPESKSNKKPKQ